MEDYEAQELEFWAKLEEEGMSRSSMLRRSAAAAFGLTVIGSASTALGATRARFAGAADEGDRGGHGDADQEREEGRPPQHDRAAARLGELRRDDLDLHEEVRDRDHERQPGRQLGAGERGDPLAQGRLARPGRRRRQPRVRDRGRQRGPVREVLQHELQDDPACPEGHPRLLDGRLLGRGLDRLQQVARQQPPEDVEGPD